MIRRAFIEAILRQVYNGLPNDDANITYNLVNHYINEGIALVVKSNYAESLQVDGIGYVNNSFYTTYKDLTITQDENFIYKFTLPQIPLGIGKNEGVLSVLFKDSDKNISKEAVIANANQVSYLGSLRPIQNKVIVWNEQDTIYANTTIDLTPYKAIVRMISGSKDSTNLDSTLQVPDDYIPKVREYVVKQLLTERAQPRDVSNDGEDKP